MPPKKSNHRQFIEFFHATVPPTRGVIPIVTPKDGANLKRVLTMHDIHGQPVIEVHELEQLALYFLANHRFKKFSPTISVFLSGGILTGLMNDAKHHEEFWREIETYSVRYLKKTTPNPSPQQRCEMIDQIAEMRRRLTASFGVSD